MDMFSPLSYREAEERRERRERRDLRTFWRVLPPIPELGPPFYLNNNKMN